MPEIPGNATTTAVLDTNLGGGTGTFSGQLETFGDHDWIRVSLTAGVDYSFSLALQILGAPDGDSQLRLHDASGAMVAENDDNSASLNSFLSFTPTVSGTYFLDVFSHASGQRGAYSVLMTDLDADVNVFFSGSNDNYSAHAGERVVAGAGDDRIDLDTSGFDAFGEQGNDNLIGNDQVNILSGGLGNDSAFGGAGDDAIFGDAGDDSLSGGDDGDQLFGGDGLDELNGGEGRDLLAGGAGTDTLAGDAGQDVFIFKSIADSVKGSGRDQILDFSHAEGDKIDVSGIDANSHKHGNQAFHFVGAHGFGHHDGELRYKGHVLSGDVNGDGRADFEIHVNADHLVKGDFVL